MKLQVRGIDPDGTFVVLITTKEPREVIKLIEHCDLDSVDITSKKGRGKIKPRGYRLEKAKDPFGYDKLVKG